MGMTPEEKSLSEEILRYLCCGRNICGITFFATPILLINSNNTSTPQSNLEDDVFLTIETRWRFFNQHPDRWPEVVGDIPEQPIEELARIGASVRELRIVDVYLAAQSPHLIISFEEDKHLFVNGHDEQYESWTLSSGEYMIVATPDSNVAIWRPKNGE